MGWKAECPQVTGERQVFEGYLNGIWDEKCGTMLSPGGCMTKAELVLKFVGDHPKGVTLKQIQTFVIMLGNHAQDDTLIRWNDREGNHERTPKARGWWCTNLYGTGPIRYATVGHPPPRPGLLRKYCTKLPSGHWILTEKIEGPFFTMTKPTKSYISNVDRERGEDLRWKESLPKCPHCKNLNYDHKAKDTWSPDGRACTTGWAKYYLTDCLKRVWLLAGGSKPQATNMTVSDLYVAQAIAKSLAPNDYEKQEQLLVKVLVSRVIS